MRHRVGDAITLSEFNHETFVVTKIVEGGFGIVLFLIPTTFGIVQSPLALKIVKNPVHKEQFDREALLWSKVSAHENIAQLAGVGQLDQELYIASRRYSKALSEVDLLRLHKADIVSIIRGIINGLEYARKSVGLVHKDIKPSNIFLDGNIAKVGDFGIVDYVKSPIQTDSTANAEVKSHGLHGGTPPFMAPELFSGRGGFGIQTDIFAFGVTLFVLLSGGKAPFFQGNQTIDPSALDIFLDNTIKKDLTGIRRMIMKCIEIDPSNRYANYDQMLQELGKSPKQEVQPNDVSSEVAAIINNVQALRRMKKYDEAIAEIRKNLQRSNSHPLLYNQIAVIIRESGEHEDAVELLEKVIRDGKHPKQLYIEPAMNLCLFYFEKKDVFSFVKVFERYWPSIEDLGDKASKMYFEIGVYFLYIKDFERAYHYFMTYAGNVSSIGIPLFGLLYTGIKLGRTEDALRILQSIDIPDKNILTLCTLFKNGQLSVQQVEEDLISFFFKNKIETVASTKFIAVAREQSGDVRKALMYAVLLTEALTAGILEAYLDIRPVFKGGISNFSLLVMPYLRYLADAPQEMPSYIGNHDMIMLLSTMTILKASLENQDYRTELNKVLERMGNLNKLTKPDVLHALVADISSADGANSSNMTSFANVGEILRMHLCKATIEVIGIIEAKDPINELDNYVKGLCCLRHFRKEMLDGLINACKTSDKG